MKQLLHIVIGNLKGEPDLSAYLLHHYKGINKQQLQNLLHKNAILLNEQTAKGNESLKKGDRIKIEIPYTAAKAIIAENIPLDIVHEEKDFIVVNKPAGMSCHPGLGIYKGTLLHALKYYFEQKNENAIENGLVHRLDKDTSGLMIVAKNEDAFATLTEIFRNKKAIRIYDALVYGKTIQDNFEIGINLGRDKNNPSWIRFFENKEEGKSAHTVFRVLEKNDEKSLLECVPYTGRTHQIRLHLLYAGHPIIGDKRYFSETYIPAERMFLHAKKLQLEYAGKKYAWERESGFTL